MKDLTQVGLFLLLMTWPGEDGWVIDRNLKIQSCAVRAAVARTADERWRYECKLVTTSAFRLFRRRT